MKRCTKRSTSASGARWLNTADSMARALRGYAGKKRRVIDGYILEGAKSGDLLRATVIDPPGYIITDFAFPARTGDGSYTLGAVAVARDEFLPGGPPPAPRPPLPGMTVHAADRAARVPLPPQPVGPQPLRESFGMNARLIAAADTYAFSRRVPQLSAHAAIELPGGYMAYGYTAFQVVTTDPVGDTTGQLTRGSTDMWRARERPETNALFAFGIVHGTLPDIVADAGAVADADGLARDWRFAGPTGLGLMIDMRWVELWIGGGARLAYDDIRVSNPGDTEDPPIGPPLGYNPRVANLQDAQDYRYTAPWCIGLPAEVSDERVVWRVVTRYCGPKQHSSEVHALWRLITFDVEVTRGDDGFPVASVGTRRVFSALDFATPADRGWRYVDGTHAPVEQNGLPGVAEWAERGYAPHAFGFPVVGAGATAIIPYMVRSVPTPAEAAESDGLEHTLTTARYAHVVLRADGRFEELIVPRKLQFGFQPFMEERAVGIRWTVFLGGANVGGRLLYINPKTDYGVAVLDAATMQLDLWPGADAGYTIPNAGLAFGNRPRLDMTEVLCRNTVCWYGGNKVAFPAHRFAPAPATRDDGIAYLLSTFDVVAGTMEDHGVYLPPEESGTYTRSVVEVGTGNEAQQRIQVRYYFTKPHMVQRWIPATDDRPEVPGVIVFGCSPVRNPSNKAPGDASTYRPGRLKASTDGGQTWSEMWQSNTISRAAWYAGNDIHRPELGALWQRGPRPPAATQ